MTLQCLNLYLDNPCGWRRYLVVQAGRKWARLVSLEDADTYRVPVALLATGRPAEIKPTRAARRLRVVAKTFGRQDHSLVREALAALRGPTHKIQDTSTTSCA